MDIYCTKCGEPWAIDCLHDAEGYGLTVRGTTIVACGGCGKGGERPAVAAAAAALHDLMPDDPDGVAAMLEDAEAWGLL